MHGRSALDYPAFTDAANSLQRVDEARPKIIASLNALKLVHRGPEAREQLVKCISATVNVTESLRRVASIPYGVAHLIGELAQLLEHPPVSIKDITSRFDFHDHKAAKTMNDLRERIQGILNRLESRLRSASVPSLPASSSGEARIGSGTATPSGPGPEDSHSAEPSKWKKFLDPSKEILRAVSLATPLIPGVGQYIQYGVDSVIVLVDMIQGMSDNDSGAILLCDKVKRLADMVAIFQDTGRPYSAEGTLREYLRSFQEHCKAVEEGTREILNQSTGRKVIFSEDNAGAVVELEKTLDAALAELELYLGLDVHRIVRDQERDHLIDLLGDADYGDAGHLKDDGLCLDGTRAQILGIVDKWAEDLSSAGALLLKGQAGRGKSTIARTVASRFRQRWGNNASCSIFHFRHNNDALNRRPLLSLVRQLALHAEPQVGNALLRAIQNHKDVARSRLQDQFDILFVEPFNELKSYPPRILFIVDALDECGDRALVSALLQLIAEHCASLPSSVKFLFTSRPEDHVIRGFQAFKMQGREENLDTVGLAVIDSDLRTYFLQQLHRIRDSHALGDSWPDAKSVDNLVSLSEGLFQWADTAMSYVKQAPKVNLQDLVDSEDVVCGLPRLYKRIFLNAFPADSDVTDRKLPKLLEHALGSLVVASRPVSPAVLGYLWNDSGDIETSSRSTLDIFKALAPLRSMLMLPDEDSPEDPVHFMHTSVRDFLIHSEFQYADFRLPIDPTVHHVRLTDICFQRMKRDLKHDICGINDPSKMNVEVFDLVELHIPSGLRYSCRSWSTHLLELKDSQNPSFNDEHSQLGEFCRERLMHWMEALSLMGALSDVFDMTRQAREWLKNTEPSQSQAGTQMATLLSDTHDFCRRFFRPMSTNAQHITLSCLFHFPTTTALHTVYATSIGQQVPRIIRGPTLHQSDWSRILRTGSPVNCVAFNPNGKILASGQANQSIRLWDVDIGQPKGIPLESNEGEILNVAFSPDGKTLASASSDGAIRFWNIEAGEPKGKTLTGNDGWAMGVAYTTDGKTLAFGSLDKAIRFWKANVEGTSGKPLIGHTRPVTSVACSPNGKIIASGSYDNTIQLWNMHNSKPKGTPLAGNDTEVRSIAFSADSKTLASASEDGKIRLWTVETGQPKGIPLVGHDGRVLSLAFSYDGKTLASGSRDRTIRLWNIDAEEPTGKTLAGHDGWVMSVAFSSDDKILASGSVDGTIRLWNFDRGEAEVQPLIGHTGSVTSVACSPDGKILASASYDNTIRLWDMDTGKPKGMPLAANDSEVRSITFSPDGTTLASASGDGMLRLWVVHTGQPKGKPISCKDTWIRSLTFSLDGKTLATKSFKKTMYWNLDAETPTATEMGAGHEVDGDLQTHRWQSDLSLIRLNTASTDSEGQGWVFIRGKRCFWLPKEFYMANDKRAWEMSFFGTHLIFHHPSIYVLDVSKFF